MTSAFAGDSVRVTVFVAVSPLDAFEVFTVDVDAWWRHGPRFRSFAVGSTLAFEDHARLVERAADGAQHEIGRVLAWEPGRRLVFEWRASNFAPDECTEVEVTFQAKHDGTEVVLVHRGFAALRGDHPVRHGRPVVDFIGAMGLWWGSLLGVYRQRR